MNNDASGNCRLMMTADRYNIWTAMQDRIPIAVDSINAICGQTATGANIELVEGAVVQGHYIDAATGKPIENGQKSLEVKSQQHCARGIDGRRPACAGILIS